jgi:hypothetical protein
MDNKYRIYMDCCCINRPYDDTNDYAISLESRAVITIAFKCFYGDWALVGSEALFYEITRTPDIEKRSNIMNLYSIIKENVIINDFIENRMNDLIKEGIKPLDALHFACAEYGKVDIMLTTDKDFLKKAQLVKSSIEIENPVLWLMEVASYGN